MRKGETIEEEVAVEAFLEVVKRSMDPRLNIKKPSSETTKTAAKFNAIARRHKGPAGEAFGDLMLTDVESGLKVVTILTRASKRRKTKPKTPRT